VSVPGGPGAIPELYFCPQTNRSCGLSKGPSSVRHVIEPAIALDEEEQRGRGLATRALQV
jgi:hypothetical protein